VPEFSTACVEGCDLCVLLVAFRRGYVHDGETLQIVEMKTDENVRTPAADRSPTGARRPRQHRTLPGKSLSLFGGGVSFHSNLRFV
jgi:hypothetical protein